MVEFYKLRECKNDYLDSQIEKLFQSQILGVRDCCSKTIVILWHT